MGSDGIAPYIVNLNLDWGVVSYAILVQTETSVHTGRSGYYEEEKIPSPGTNRNLIPPAIQSVGLSLKYWAVQDP